MKINIQKIERLVKEQLDNGEAEALLEPLRELANQRRYGLVWEEPDSGAYEEEHAEKALLENFPFLTELGGQAIVKDEEAPTNLLIEGDNLHALQALQYSHQAKVDVIYIDPPYNTGSKDFVYNDRFVDKEDSWRHSSWLSFMNKRLTLAKDLMTDEGVIFLSIDDHEQAQLKLLCDQIFGEDSHVTTLIWQRKTGASDAKGIATITEYIHVYCKTPDVSKWTDIFARNYESYDEKRYKERDEHFEERGPFYYDNLDRGGLSYSDSLNFPIECPDGTVTYPNGRTEYENDGWNWKWGRDKVKWGFENDFLEVRPSKQKANGWGVYYKNYLLVDNENRPIDRSAPFKNLLLGMINTKGTTELNDIFGRKVFNNPKPTELIKQLVGFIAKKDAIVLDFFAGSGTTGHAVMALNEEDEGRRQFILCTNNEISPEKEKAYLVDKGHIEAFQGRRNSNAYKEYMMELEAFKESSVYKDITESDEYKCLGIARAVTYERNKRVIEGYTTRRGKEIEGLENNLRYFTVDLKKDSKDEDFNAFKLIGDTIDVIRIKEDLFNHQESLTIDGIPVVKLVDSHKEVLIVLDVDVLDEDIDKIVERFEDVEKEHVIYASYKNYPYQNIRHEDIPNEILRALKMKELN